MLVTTLFRSGMKIEDVFVPFLFEHGIVLEWFPEAVWTTTSAVLHESFLDSLTEESDVMFEEWISWKESVRSELAQIFTA